MNHHQNESVLAAVQDPVPSQPLETMYVNLPVLRRIHWVQSTCIQLYALGRGVTVTGKGSNLLRREGSFELEANGMVFVFDPIDARHAYGFVASIESDIAAISHLIEAVDEENLPEFGLTRIAHDDVFKKTVVLSLPQGMGKSTIAKKLATQLDLTRIVDSWDDISMPLIPGALHLTHAVIPEA